MEVEDVSIMKTTTDNVLVSALKNRLDYENLMIKYDISTNRLESINNAFEDFIAWLLL